MVSNTTDKPASISRWYDPILFKVALPVFVLFLKLLLASYRLLSVKGEEREREALVKSGGNAVYATWHQRIAFHARTFSKRDITVMVSKSRDGEYAARIANSIGVKDVRGSSTRGGRDALKALTERVVNGSSGGMIVDGPQGPPRQAKIGAVIMARNAGVPLIPAVWGTDRCWIFNSWDRLMIPKPFSRIAYCYCEPIWIPRSAEGQELERYRKLLEERLNEGTRWCDQQFGLERPWRKRKKGVSMETEPSDRN